jgi:hypothetical protein
LTEVVLAVGKKFKLRFDELHNDSTSISFAGTYRAATGRAIRGRTAPPMATSNSSTCGHPNSSRQDGQIIGALRCLGRVSRRRALDPRFRLLCERLFGKRSASGRRHRPGSGGQATNPAGAVHRLVLWAGGLSTAGARPEASGVSAWSCPSWGEFR